MNTKTIGSALIGFGILMLLIQLYGIQVDLTLFLLGGCFLTVYFATGSSRKRNVGFLIPGSILTSLAVMEILNDIVFFEAFQDLLFFGCLSGAFLAIRIIGGINGNQVKWASIVALALAAFTLFLVVVKYTSYLEQYGDLLFPVIFIGVGLLLVLSTVVATFKKNRY